jgi:hypothetical protein
MCRIELGVLAEIISLPLGRTFGDFQPASRDPLISPERKSWKAPATPFPHQSDELVPRIYPMPFDVAEVAALDVVIGFKRKIVLKVPSLGIPSSNRPIHYWGIGGKFGSIGTNVGRRYEDSLTYLWTTSVVWVEKVGGEDCGGVGNAIPLVSKRLDDYLPLVAMARTSQVANIL